MVKGEILLTIPNSHRGDIGVNLLKLILKEAGFPARSGLSSGEHRRLFFSDGREANSALNS